MTPAEAERLAIAQGTGRIQLSLRGYGDPDSIRTTGANSDDVLAQLRAAPIANVDPAPAHRTSSGSGRRRGPGPAGAGAAAGGSAPAFYRRSRSQAESGRHERRHDLQRQYSRIRGSSSARIPRKPIQQSGTNRRFDPNLVPASRETFPSEPHSSFPRSCRRPQRTRLVAPTARRAGNRRPDHTHRAPRGAIATDHHAGPDHARLGGDAGNRRRGRR